MNLEQLQQRQNEIKQRLDLLNVKSTGRDRLVSEMQYIEAMIKFKRPREAQGGF